MKAHYWGHDVLYAAAIGMEWCWLYALTGVVNAKAADGNLSVPGLLALFPVSFFFNVLLERTKWHRFLLRAITWIVWAAASLFTAKLMAFGGAPWLDTGWITAVAGSVPGVIYGFTPELVILIMSAVLWQLGRRMSHTRVTFATTVGEFQFGLAILLILFFISVPLEAEPTAAIPTVLVFFTLGLCGMSVAHALEGTSWLSGVHRERWLALLGVSTVLVLVTGLVVSDVINRDLIQMALNVINWIWEMTMNAIAFLVSLLPQPETPEMPMETPAPGAGAEETVQFFSMPEWLRETLRLGWGILMLGIFLLALWRLSTQVLMWLHRRLSGTPGTEFQSLPGALRGDILRVLRAILWLLTLPFRLRRRASATPPETSPVRQVYRELLRRMTRHGHARVLSQTPREYLGALVAVLPGAVEDLRLITGQYMAARYGGESPDDDTLCQLQESWHRVKRTRLKKAGGQQSRNGGKTE